MFSKKHEASIASDLPSQGYLDSPELNRKYFGVQRQYCFRCDFLFRKPRRCLVSVVHSIMAFHILLSGHGSEGMGTQQLPATSSVPCSSCSHVLSFTCVLMRNFSACPPTHVPDVFVHIHGQTLFMMVR